MRNVFEVPRPPWGPRYGPYMAFRRHPTLDHLDFTYVAPDPPLEPSEFERLLQESGRLLLQEDGSLILLEPPAGPFTVSFADLPDGAIPYTETRLRDMFLDYPRSQDEMGIRGGKLAVVDFRGPDQAFYPADAGGGRRGLLWRNTGSLTNNVSGVYDGSIYNGAGPDLPAFGPTLHISTDEDDHWVGISSWFVPPPFNWAELGVIGWKQEEFSYLDMHLGLDFPEPGDEVKLRSVDGMVAIEINGEVVLGPCEIPAELLGSPIHGIQMDVALDTDEELGVMEGVIIEEDSTPLGGRVTPLTPAVGVEAETASSTTINVPYPGGIAAGNALYCFIATKNGGSVSASGWTDVPTGFGGAVNLSIRCLRKVATGSEAGSLTVTKSTAGIMAGCMIRATGDNGQGGLSGAFNGSASTVLTSPALQIFGPRRTALWVAATSIDTNILPPPGFFALSAGVVGGEALRLSINVVVMDTHADFPDPPIFNAYASDHFPAQVGSCASAATSAVGTLVLHPDRGA